MVAKTQMLKATLGRSIQMPSNKIKVRMNPEIVDPFFGA